MEDLKKADNRILNTKIEIGNLEDNLSQTKKGLNNLEILESNFSRINRNLNECLDLINSCVKNKRINNKLQNICDESNIYYGKTKSNFDEERELIINQINEIDERLDELNKSLKEELNKEKEEKEEKDNEEELEEIVE
jgi:hypothetical protein